MAADELTPSGTGPDSAEATPAPGGLTPREVKQIVQELLKSGVIDSAQRPAQFEAVARLRREVNAVLDALDLALVLDEHRGLGLLRVAESAAATPDEEWSHPLVRRQRLTLEQSLLVALLRQAFLLQEQEAGVGVAAARVSLDDLLPQLNAFLGDSGSDARNEQRLLTLLDQLKTHNIVSEPDAGREVIVRPLIAHLANPETLTALLASFRQQAGPEVAP